MEMSGPGAYWFGEEEVGEVMDVLESGHLMRYGALDNKKFKRKVYTFEKEFAKYCSTDYALLTSSGSSSILLSLLAVGLKPGDEIIVPAYTFIATYSSPIFVDLVPVLAEIDESLTIDPADIERRITSKTKAILPVHMLGNPCEMDAIMNIAKKHNLLVIEDACQACGGAYKSQKLGSIGQMGAISLNMFKIITAGDGGAVITKDKELYERVFAFHDQGHSPHRASLEVGHRNIIGMNFRANEFVGAVALAQLRKLDKIISTLREKKKKLKEMISDIDCFKFRKINDLQGECATICTLIFETAEKAKSVSKALGTVTVDHSGWHVYSNMEHICRHLKEIGQPYGKGAYPKTDDILSRCINISVGVVDAGIGAGFGININSSDEKIEKIARRIRDACK